LAGDASDTDDGLLATMDEHEAHLKEDLELIGDLRGRAISETFGAIAALKEEAPTLGGFRQLLLEGFDLPGGDEGRELGEFVERGFERGQGLVLDLMGGGFGAPGVGGPGCHDGGVSKGGHVAV